MINKPSQFLQKLTEPVLKKVIRPALLVGILASPTLSFSQLNNEEKMERFLEIEEEGEVIIEKLEKDKKKLNKKLEKVFPKLTQDEQDSLSMLYEKYKKISDSLAYWSAAYEQSTPSSEEEAIAQTKRDAYLTK